MPEIVAVAVPAWKLRPGGQLPLDEGDPGRGAAGRADPERLGPADDVGGPALRRERRHGRRPWTVRSWSRSTWRVLPSAGVKVAASEWLPGASRRRRAPRVTEVTATSWHSTVVPSSKVTVPAGDSIPATPTSGTPTVASSVTSVCGFAVAGACSVAVVATISIDPASQAPACGRGTPAGRSRQHSGVAESPYVAPAGMRSTRRAGLEDRHGPHRSAPVGEAVVEVQVGHALVAGGLGEPAGGVRGEVVAQVGEGRVAAVHKSVGAEHRPGDRDRSLESGELALEGAAHHRGRAGVAVHADDVALEGAVADDRRATGRVDALAPAVEHRSGDRGRAVDDLDPV